MCFGPGDTWMRTLDETDSYFAIPLEQDGLQPSLLFAGTLACIQKRSGLVPTVSVLWFGLPMCFGSFHALTHAGLDAADGFIAIHHEGEGAPPSFLFASTSA